MEIMFIEILKDAIQSLRIAKFAGPRTVDSKATSPTLGGRAFLGRGGGGVAFAFANISCSNKKYPLARAAKSLLSIATKLRDCPWKWL